MTINLQGLAASLSTLPVWTVLDLDASLCQSFLPAASQAEAADRSPSHGKDVTSQHPLPSTSANVPRSSMQLQSEKSAQALQSKRIATHVESKETVPEEQDDTTSTATPVLTDYKQSPAVPRQIPVQGHASVLQKNSHDTQQEGLHSPSGAPDTLDLDDLLNTPYTSAKPQASSTAIAKPGLQDQDSLEDWLNSL